MKFSLAPGTVAEMTIRMDFDALVQKSLIQHIDLIGSKIYLAVIFPGIELFEHKKMYLEILFFHHQIIIIIRISPFGESQFVDVVIPGNVFVPHGELWMQ